MGRNLFRFLLIVFVIALIRYLLTAIGRGVASYKKSGSTPGSSRSARAAKQGGELRQDPVCGTFVAVSTSVKQNVDGKIVHFCSTECRDKYHVA